MAACECAWTCPGPYRMCHFLWAWTARLRAVTVWLTNPFYPTHFHLPYSPPQLQGFYTFYCPDMTSGIWNFYLIPGRNLSLTGYASQHQRMPSLQCQGGREGQWWHQQSCSVQNYNFLFGLQTSWHHRIILIMSDGYYLNLNKTETEPAFWVDHWWKSEEISVLVHK